MPDLTTTLGNLRLRNPVLTASGTCGYGEELAEVFDLALLGGIVTKTVTTAPRPGNAPPRVCETTAGMLNSIGLQNVGIDAFIAQKVPFIRKFEVPLIANIAGDSIEDFAELARRLNDVDGITAIELNLSCPNVAGGLDFSTKPELTCATVAAVKAAATRLPVIAKLSPNVTDIVEIARAAEDGGADAVSLINTLVGMSIEIENRKSKIQNGFGGLSGPAIKPVALRMVYQVAGAVRIPVIGIGGISSTEDAIEFLMADDAVQVGTATFANPRAAVDVIEGLEEWLTRHGIASVREVIGAGRA